MNFGVVLSSSIELLIIRAVLAGYETDFICFTFVIGSGSTVGRGLDSQAVEPSSIPS